jgi:diacylglycerol kinase family enzyme
MPGDKFVIVANPKAGALGIDDKLRLLKPVSEILGPDCEITGLDTESLDDLCSCAAKAAKNGRIVVIASGDTTIVPVAEAVKNAAGPEAVLSYLPLGSANALWYAMNMPLWLNIYYAFNLKESLQSAAKIIKKGKVRDIDLILADGHKKTLFASIGIEGDVIADYDLLLSRKKSFRTSREGRFAAYANAILSAYKSYARPEMARVTFDGKESVEIKNALSIIVTKIPFYGFGLKVMPAAKMDDGQMHARLLNSSLMELSYELPMSFLRDNSVGAYFTAKDISIETTKGVYLQADGGIIGEKKTRFDFKLLPAELKMKY